MIERYLEAELLGQATGRRYRIDVAKLTVEEQRELLRLINDLKGEVTAIKNKVRREPWRLIH